ncbi:MAG TPA: DNA ligase D [Gemmatimonadales bacterium]|nr:DNA ligase D [Gemmatimonadales bacterium]
MPSRESDPLAAYRAKRALERTPEPSGSRQGNSASMAGGLFVVHKHAARNLHFDLRLEMDGVLRSWAVPKGPSYDTADKRLAVMVEDHPLEYGDFEGLIPEGNYGAGAVIVWDRGRWEPVEDPVAGLEKGKLLFDLHGVKLRGRWTLVKLKKGDREWLFIKERDAYASDPFPPEESVLSGLTVEDLKAGRTPVESIRTELARLGAARREVRPEAAHLMLAESRERPFSDPKWLFELKLDGYRLLAARDQTAARLISRNGNDLSSCFPEVKRALAALPGGRLLIDGEVVALDQAGRPSFQRLQQRGKLSRALDIRRATVENPATFFAFDLLAVDDYDLRPLPLLARKELLRKLLPAAGLIRFLDHFEGEGVVLYEQVRKLGMEGIVAKRSDSPYRPGRSAAWLKIRTRRTDDFVVVGFTSPKGGRTGFGALYLAQYVDGELTYCGRAGTGFSDLQLTELRATLEAMRRSGPACGGPIPKEKGATWTDPRLVCEVEFTEWTDEGLLRQPVFLRFRDDKRPEECVGGEAGKRGSGEVRWAAGQGEPEHSEGKARNLLRGTPNAADRQISFTNLTKVFWPDEGYTKGYLIEYYRTIAPWILPYLADRPVVLTRYPDGVNGKSFFQKDAPGFVPDWVRTERMWSEQAEREIDYFVCDDESALLYVVNLGTIPLHVWASRCASIDRPDWCVLDLDPKGAPFSHVIHVAQVAHQLCEDIGLPNYIKTSGSSGLHLLIPLAGQCRYDEARSLGELLARVIVTELPEISTSARQVSRRDGKVYVDYLQNGSGRLLVSPFSVRALPGGPVSMPLRWSEVNEELDIRSFTMETVPVHMGKLKADPLRDVLTTITDLSGALDRLGRRG